MIYAHFTKDIAVYTLSGSIYLDEVSTFIFCKSESNFNLDITIIWPARQNTKFQYHLQFVIRTIIVNYELQ